MSYGILDGILGGDVPAGVPGEELTRDDMARVSADDWADLRTMARGYCRGVDATRSRKRVDRSATISRNGHAPYGTDDVSDDVTQDAVLIFAHYLTRTIGTCAVASVWVDTREPASWLYVRKDGQTVTVTRKTIQRWAVRDAAERNGYRLDIPVGEPDATPGQQLMRGLPHAEHVATANLISAAVSQQNAVIWRTAYGDGSDYPTLREFIFLGSQADNLKHAGIIATVAQARHGGAYGSRRNVVRTRDEALKEWTELRPQIDQARDNLLMNGDKSCSGQRTL